MKKFPQLLKALRDDPVPGTEALAAFDHGRGVASLIVRVGDQIRITFSNEVPGVAASVSLQDLLALGEEAKKFTQLKVG